LSWQNALRDGQLAVDRLQLKNEEIAGKVLDLNVLLADHPSRGRYRVMIFQAAHRILEKRGALTNLKALDVKRRREPGEK
jgi:hypothetical protein